MKRILLAAASALALAAAPISAANAVGEPVCTVDYDLSSPAGYAETGGHTFVGGLSTVNRTVTLKRTACDIRPASTTWTVTGPGFVASGTLGNLVDETVAVTPPTSNRSAGLHTNGVTIVIGAVPAVVADPTATPPVLAADAVPAATFHADIVLKRRVGGTKTDAAPEPVKLGQKITVTGRFSVADWSEGDYVALSGRNARLQSRVNPGSYNDASADAVDVTDARGTASLVLTPAASRVWRFDFKGSRTLGHVDLVGDFVKVK
jgi:hypothetical protein